jgi:hypothetical protein
MTLNFGGRDGRAAVVRLHPEVIAGSPPGAASVRRRVDHLLENGVFTTLAARWIRRRPPSNACEPPGNRLSRRRRPSRGAAGQPLSVVADLPTSASVGSTDPLEAPRLECCPRSVTDVDRRSSGEAEPGALTRDIRAARDRRGLLSGDIGRESVVGTETVVSVLSNDQARPYLTPPTPSGSAPGRPPAVRQHRPQRPNPSPATPSAEEAVASRGPRPHRAQSDARGTRKTRAAPVLSHSIPRFLAASRVRASRPTGSGHETCIKSGSGASEQSTPPSGLRATALDRDRGLGRRSRPVTWETLSRNHRLG